MKHSVEIATKTNIEELQTQTNELATTVSNHNHDATYAKKTIYDDTTINIGRRSDTTVGTQSVALGSVGTASGNYSCTEGYNTKATGKYSHAEGIGTNATGEDSHVEGTNTRASGDASHAENSNTIASGDASHAEGYMTNSSGNYSHVEGYGSAATTSTAHAEGMGSNATGEASHSEGAYTNASNYASHACGKYNKDMTKGGSGNAQIGDVFVIGNGNGSTKSNAFRVTYTGDVLTTKAYTSSGADYAEFIKPWFDNNETNEDRIGYFVTIKDGKLYKANDGDYIAGITSGNPSVIGNGDEDYYWRYERDKFNRIVMEDVPELVQRTDEESNPLFDEETHEPIMEETGNIIPNGRMKLNPNYDSSKQNEYIPRSERKEWDYVGMIGVLPVRDDGTCVPGQFCKCGTDGIATIAGQQGFNTFYCIERIDEETISVILK